MCEMSEVKRIEGNILVFSGPLSEVLKGLKELSEEDGQVPMGVRFLLAQSGEGISDRPDVDRFMLFLQEENSGDHRAFLSSLGATPEGFRLEFAGYFYGVLHLEQLRGMLRESGATFDIRADISRQDDNLQQANSKGAKLIRLLESNQSRLLVIKYADYFFAFWFSATSLRDMGFNDKVAIENLYNFLSASLVA